MGWCETLLPFLLDPLTYIIGGGSILGAAALYSYSSYAFLPSMVVLSRLTSPLNFVWNRIKEAWKYGLLKLVAAYTTFEGTITTVMQEGFTVNMFLMAGQEFLTKASQSIKNIVEGLSFFTQWLSGYTNGVCTLAQSSDLLVSAAISIWTGIAAYIFVIWVWNKMWYDWRSREMEQQQLILIIVVVSSLSLAVYGFEVVNQALSNGMSLVDTLAQLGGEVGGNESINSTN